jgi:UrcA family protein
MTTKPPYRSMPLAMATILGLFGAAQALPADEPDGVRSITVNFRDLNLSTIAGATTLYQRIKKAAGKVCQEPDSFLNDLAAWTRCYRGAIDDAVAKVNSPLLTAVHSGTSRDPTVTAMNAK